MVALVDGGMPERYTSVKNRFHLGGETAPAPRAAPASFPFSRWILDATLILVLAAGVLGLRWQIMFQAPFTDDGGYAAFAWALGTMEPGALPDLLPGSTLAAYPSLVAPLIVASDTPLLLARQLDAGIAAMLAGVIFLLLRRVAGLVSAFVVAAACSASLNSPVFIDAGAKNPACAGFLFLGIASWIVATPTGDLGRTRAAVAGIFAGCAVLAREPLAIYLGLLLPVVWAAAGRRAAGWTALGIVLAAVAGIALIAWSRGGDFGAQLHAIHQGLARMPRMYAEMAEPYDLAAHRRWLWNAVAPALGWVIFPAFGVAFVALVSRAIRRRDPAAPPPPGTWACLVGLLASSLALPEPWFKLGFPYHVSYSLFGAAFAAAAGLGLMRRLYGSRGELALLCAALVGAACVPAGTGQASWGAWRAQVDGAAGQSRIYRAAMEGDWTDAAVERSFYLAAARVLRERSQPGDTLLVSGWYLGLYPLSGVRPWRTDQLDLLVHAMTETTRTETSAELPTFFVQTDRYPKFRLEKYFRNLPADYVLIAEIGHREHYSGFKAKIWQRRTTTEASPDPAGTAATNSRAPPS